MVVVDASAVVELLVGGSRSAQVERHVALHGFDLHAPAVVDTEVLSALRRLVSACEVAEKRADQAVEDLLDLPLTRYAQEALVPRIWELKGNFTAYDAAYVALADALADDGVPLLTTDAKLARAARAHTDVEVLLAR